MTTPDDPQHQTGLSIQDVALAWHDAGFCVLPTATDGSKRPGVGTWKTYQHEQFPREALTGSGLAGIGLVCGQISGSLEMLELEGRAVEEGAYATIATAATAAGLVELWKRVTEADDAYLEMTPSGGVHILYRLSDGPVPGNTKLASRPARDEELTDSERDLVAKGRTVIRGLAETRGEGGYVVIAPSGGPTHPSGEPWVGVTGRPGRVPVLTLAEREQLHGLFRQLDQMPAAAPRNVPVPGDTAGQRPIKPTAGTPGVGVSPGDDFAARTSWEDILVPEGWQVHHVDAGITYWTRPGKALADGHSATTNHGGTDRLKVHTSSTVFDSVLETGETYSKFGAWTLLNHDGDHSAAARSLAGQGYGTPTDAVWPLATPAAAWFSAPQSPLATPAVTAGVEATVGQSPTVSPRPPLDVGNPAIMFDWLRANLGAGPLAGMFLRGADLVHTPREGEEGYVALRGSVEDGDDGPAQVQLAFPEYVAARVQIAFSCYRMVKKKDDFEPKPALFPTSAATRVSAVLDELPQLRRLRGVVHTPAFRPDGSLINVPGYDQVTRMLYLPEAGLSIPAIPPEPTPAEVHAAVGLIGQLLSGFPFTSAHTRANYIGALITPLLRAIVPPPYKLIAIGAHQRGSGKTKLANVARIVHGGVFRAEFPGDEAELGKQVTAILDMTTGPVVVFDNVSGVLRSSKFAGLLTSPDWGDRELGKNRWIGAPNDRMWVVTGNNLALGGDIPRRTVSVNIDPGVPRPELRTGFAIGDPEVWATRHRGLLLHALLVIVQSWVVAGMPLGPERTSDGYARWTRTVEGILTNAGIAGGFDAGETQVEVGRDDDEWEDFLAAVHAARGSAIWTVKDLLADVDTSGILGISSVNRKPIPFDALPVELAEKASRSPQGLASISKTLGRWLMNRDGRWAGNLTIRSAGISHKTKLWQVAASGDDSGKAGTETGGFGGLGGLKDTHAQERNFSRSSNSALPERPESNPSNPQTPLTAPVEPGYCARCDRGVPALAWLPCDRCGKPTHARGRGAHGSTCHACLTERKAS